MKPLTDFLPEVMPHVAGCPVPVVINAVRNSVIEFLKTTGMLQQTIPIVLIPFEPSYPIASAVGTAAQTFVRGLVDSVYPVSATAPGELENSNRLWRVSVGNVPTHAFIENGRLTVTPVPNVAASLDAVFTSTPSRSATDVEDHILEDFIEEIGHGALYRLFMLPGYAWSNPELSAYHKSVFDTAMSDAALDRIKGSTDTSLTVKPRRFG